MAKLKNPITVETAFGPYILDEFLGEGGAGRVFGGVSPDNTKIAIKVLSKDRVTTDKRRRFKNETAFLIKNKHDNIVSVIDYGIATTTEISGPFYVMRRYDCNLRDLMASKSSPQETLAVFGKILDGVEAAHLLGAVHRDLKPENILFDRSSKTPAVADFGVASFTDDIIATIVETGPTQRLANFMYAAPEQRVPGRQVGLTADIYALGLILNELFTSNVPHGTDFQSIGMSHPEFSYLDAVVTVMMKQDPRDRFDSIQKVKGAIASHHAEFITLQKLSKIDAAVIPAGQVDDPLAYSAPKLVGANWSNGTLVLTIDREVNQNWVNALRNMGSFTSVMNLPPQAFQFNGRDVRAAVSSNDAQRAIDFFKEWLPRATQVLKFNLEQEVQQREFQQREQLKRERAAEERQLQVNKSLKI